ncbi:hypothetical protein NIA69_02965 [Gemmiger formicilis]|nr:hypothetical protein [Gemmiger formicilis]
MGRASLLLKNAGQSDKAKEMCDRVTASQSYHKALSIVSEYVETELTPTPSPNMTEGRQMKNTKSPTLSTRQSQPAPHPRCDGSDRGCPCGMLGGFVETDENLDQEGLCMDFEDAIACEDSLSAEMQSLRIRRGKGSAYVGNNAAVTGMPLCRTMPLFAADIFRQLHLQVCRDSAG